MFQNDISDDQPGLPRVAKCIRELARERAPEAVQALLAALNSSSERSAAATVLGAYAHIPMVKRALRIACYQASSANDA